MHLLHLQQQFCRGKDFAVIGGSSATNFLDASRKHAFMGAYFLPGLITESRDRKQKEAAAAFVVGEECGNVEALCQTFLKRGQVTFSQRGKAREKKKKVEEREEKKKKKKGSKLLLLPGRTEAGGASEERQRTAGAAAERRRRRGPVPEPRTAGCGRRGCDRGAAAPRGPPAAIFISRFPFPRAGWGREERAGGRVRAPSAPRCSPAAAGGCEPRAAEPRISYLCGPGGRCRDLPETSPCEGADPGPALHPASLNGRFVWLYTGNAPKDCMIIPGGRKRRHIVASTEKEQEQEGKSFLLPLWHRYQVPVCTQAKYWFSESD
ncbi:uncharacterized protein LOC134048461 [Cinclus cinclus]|uniref:uncharacterized protein LOC134048461 n=1 Tax=Cinclus cinclus TaxID=127875 RepID=UPI002E15FF55